MYIAVPQALPSLPRRFSTRVEDNTLHGVEGNVDVGLYAHIKEVLVELPLFKEWRSTKVQSRKFTWFLRPVTYRKDGPNHYWWATRLLT